MFSNKQSDREEAGGGAAGVFAGCHGEGGKLEEGFEDSGAGLEVPRGQGFRCSAR